jgi:hypothetical protein
MRSPAARPTRFRSVRRLAAARATRLAALLAGAMLVGIAPIGPAGAVAGLLPPNFPLANIGWQYGPPCASGQLDQSTACQASELSQIDSARANEATGPMNLPSNYASLTVPEQIFVVTELERVDRGLPPLLGLTATADASAQAGAVAGTDPAAPAGSRSAATAWSGGDNSPLEADFGWMYDDGCGTGPAGGPGSGNIACTTSTSWDQWPSWGHRDVILSSLLLPGCAACVAGAGYSTAPGYPSFTLVVAAPSGSTPPLVFTWSADIRPFLAVAPPGCTTTDPNAAQGYALVGADGGAFAFGSTTFAGSLGGTNPTWPLVGIAVTPGGGGYWLVDDDGGVHAFGDAPDLGGVLNNPSGPRQYRPGKVASAIASTPDGQGYWVTDPTGDVYAFGDARWFGSLSGTHPTQPIVGIAPTDDGGGYWLVGADGGVFAFGDATFDGSMGGRPLNSPIVGIAADQSTGGYWLVAADGGTFAFDAPFYGSMGGQPLVEGIAGMVPTPSGAGYRLVAYDGGVFNFGDAQYQGSAACLQLAAPIVAVAD